MCSEEEYVVHDTSLLHIPSVWIPLLCFILGYAKDKHCKMIAVRYLQSSSLALVCRIDSTPLNSAFHTSRTLLL